MSNTGFSAEMSLTDDKDEDKSIATATQDEEELTKSIQRAQRHWGTNPEGTLFWGTSNVEDIVPPGLYKCSQREDVGPCFQKLMIETDALIQLPDMVCNEVIAQIKEFWSDEVKQALESRGFMHKRGIMMFGEPGSGKTCTIQMLVKMLIDNGGIAIYAEDPSILSNCLQLLRRIEADRPVIVILEDFDTLTDRDRRENNWLAVLDGEAQIKNVVFLATTNYIENIDKRFVDRPSRFDIIMPVPMPSARCRAAYIRYKEPSLTDDELFEWVQESDGFSLAHVKEMIISVLCFGKSLKETVQRLNTQRKREFKNTTLESEAKGSTGIGFSNDSGSKGSFNDRDSFDNFLVELDDWDYNVSDEITTVEVEAEEV
jgi:SpoVK/Ycf46/Vps4 family AAA+-type ATPase